MSVVRGTALANYPSLVAGLGGDPATLLRAAGVRDQDVGNYDAFISIRAAIRAIESAAAVTATMDFGRRLAQRQGIEILGPVGVAARTAATVGDALAIFNTFMAAYSPVIAIRITPLAGQRSFIALEFLLDEPASYPQTMELALGVALGVIRLLLGADYAPLAVHLPHDPLTPEAFYLQYFGCRPYFAERVGGFTMRTADLSRPLNRDDVAHRVVVDYLSSITPLGRGDRGIGAHHRAPAAAHRSGDAQRGRRAVPPAPENAATSTCGGEHHIRYSGRSGPQGCRRSLPKDHRDRPYPFGT